MKLSKMLFITDKTSKSGCIGSYSLMLRAGYIKQLSAGIYQYAPIFCRVMNRIKSIIHQEMHRIDANEVDLSPVQPTSIWEESGRLSEYIKSGSIALFTDRSNKSYCLAPTAEESAVKMIDKWVSTYKKLPVSIYQLNEKFRDEIRPKNGLMRSKSFIMKDAYSFSDSEEQAFVCYEGFKSAYIRIMDRLGVEGTFVKADSGAIGGDCSEEFQAFVDGFGDSIIITDERVGYNVEVARADLDIEDELILDLSNDGIPSSIHTPDIKTINELCKFTKFTKEKIIKTVAFCDTKEEKIILACVRGDREVNLYKLEKIVGYDLKKVNDSILRERGLFPGFLGPLSKEEFLTIVIDDSLKLCKNMLCGDSRKDYHRILSSVTEIVEATFGDIDLAKVGDKCISGGTFTSIRTAVEVSHVFMIGDKYSKAMKATFSDARGNEVPFVMGCYGIGVSRLPAVCIEQNNDSRGIIWDKKIAPFLASIVYTDINEESAMNIYDALIEDSLDIAIDDRKDLSFGAKLKDSDLVGIPYKIILGKNFSNSRKIEVEDRFGAKDVIDSVDALKEFMKASSEESISN